MVKDDFLSGAGVAQFNVNECVLFYQALPEDRTYNDKGDCTKQEGFEEAVAAVIARLKSR
jgi:hypothetical protein